MTGYSNLIAQAQQFYGALHRTNTRDWWLANRGPYDEVLKPAAHALLAELSPSLSQLADAPVTGKLFRPHRDVRFSKDKTPYNTHLHMMWSITGDARQMPVFFFGIGLDYVTTGVGMMEFAKEVLDDWRKFVDLDTKRITGILTQVETAGFALREPALKRVPSGFPADHPAARLLRMKGLVASRELPINAVLPDEILASFKAAWPVNALLIQIAES